MKLLKRFLITLIILYKNFLYFITKPQQRRLVYKNVPHYSQWESKELIGSIIQGKISAEDDPKWKNSGAKTKLDYLNWSWNACGIACLQMILAYKFQKKTPLVKLCEQSLVYGCFKLNSKAFNSGDYERSLGGLFYKPFLKFIKEEFGLNGAIMSPMVLGDILNSLNRKYLVMASVGGPLYGGNGGHLVLITGYDLTGKVLNINDPSVFFKDSKRNNEVKFENFLKQFSYRGLSISIP
ncbi:hypothetical protein C4577_01695 [Candidatus Parcubacteria bacterium]|nr:MAG: hypothetical protein C4577_01695 [Candidatus Parcubacteria bacterium]